MIASRDCRFEAAPDVHARPLHDEVVVLDMAGGEYFALDAIGAQVWKGLIAGESVAEVCARLAGEYDAEASRIEADVLALVGELTGRRLLREKP